MPSAPDRIEIQPVSGPIVGAIRPPGSKSITNRALVCAALAEGPSELRGALDSEDTQVMLAALEQLGIALEHDRATHTIKLHGSAGQLSRDRAELFVGNSGTTIRFLTAMLAACNGHFRLDGVPRMRERPIGDLVNALHQLGGAVSYDDHPGFPPVVVKGVGLAGGSAVVRGDISSQFLSGLLMACPYAQADVDLTVEGVLVSQPYVTMTLQVMRSFGVSVDVQDLQRFRIPGGQRYWGCVYEIEPDASAASYFWGAAAVTGGRVTVEGLRKDALQGDVAFCECLAQMGCQVEYGPDGVTVAGRSLKGIDVNMNAISDTVQTLATVALFASGPTTIRDVAHIRHKETDRIGDLARELRRLGAHVEEHADGMTITPQPLHAAQLNTYRDHRMAMSLALAGLRVPGVVIKDPDCTRKTYPQYFADLERLVAPARTRS